MALSETASMVEVIWTIGALCGLILATTAFFYAREDHRQLRRAGINSWLGVIARGAVRNEFTRIVIKTIFVAIGIFAMEAAPRSERPIELEFVSWGLVIVIWVLVVQGIWNIRDRQKLMTYGKPLEWEN